MEWYHFRMRILINALTHGDERVGLSVIKRIKKLPIKHGQLVFSIANEKAYKKNKRFIDQDLNRSFPGKKNGNHEEKLAYKLLPLVKSADIVIDIHSTTSDLKDAIIVTKLEKKTKEYVNIISPKYVLVMKATKNNALISSAQVGIAFEYGKDRSILALNKIELGIKRLLSHLGMIDHFYNKNQKEQTVYFNVYKTVPRPINSRLLGGIKNYNLIRKEQVYATSAGKQIKAESDFYPILFGEKKYKDIFGFAGKKLTR